MSGETFGQALRRTRRERGLGLRELGRMTDFHYTYIAHVERGRQAGSPALAKACDRALDADGRLVARFTTTATESEDIVSLLRRTFLAGSAGLIAASGVGAGGCTARRGAPGPRVDV